MGLSGSEKCLRVSIILSNLIVLVSFWLLLLCINGLACRSIRFGTRWIPDLADSPVEGKRSGLMADDHLRDDGRSYDIHIPVGVLWCPDEEPLFADVGRSGLTVLNVFSMQLLSA